MDLFFKHKVNPVPGSFHPGQPPTWRARPPTTFGGPWTYRDWIGKLAFELPIADWPLGPSGKRVSASMGSGYPITTNSKIRDETWLDQLELLGKDPDRSVLRQFVKTGVGTPVRFSPMKEDQKTRFAPPNVSLVAPAEKYSTLGRPISPTKPELDKIWAEERARLLTQEVASRTCSTGGRGRIQPLLDQNKGWDAAR